MMRGLVIPAKAGIQGQGERWIPAFAGMTSPRVPRGLTALLSRPLGQRRLKLLELLQRRSQVLDDLGGDDLRRGQVRGVLQRLVLQPEHVEARFVACDELLV